MDELNVKKVGFIDDVGAMGRQEIAVNSRVLGPRLGGRMKEVLAAVRSGNCEIRNDGTLFAAGEVIQPDEFELRIIAEEGHACMSDGGLFVCLDLHINRELELEGLARDVIRMVQNARREADLVPDDRIILGLSAGGDLREAITRHESLIKSEVLATALTFDQLSCPIYTEKVEIQGENMEIMVGKDEV